MRIQHITPETTLTNEELFLELEHRLSTFGETLGGYETGGIKITYHSEMWGDKEYWINYLETDENNQMWMYLIENTQGITSPDDIPLLVFEDNTQFRDVLIQALTAKYQVYHLDEFKEEVDQQDQLKGRKCEICRENTTPVTPHSLEELPAPMQGHFDIIE